MICESILQLVGRTPHVQLRNHEQEATTTYLKLEGFNPTGSIKDRSCVYMLQDLIRRGKLQPPMVLLDASSGNMACAIAFYGALLGFRSTVVVNSKLTREKQDFLHYYGATLYQIGNFTIEGNRFCREMIAEGAPDQYCFLDQLHNWTNPKAHEETTGPEILTDFPDVAMVVGSLGSGGSLFGTARFLKEKRPQTKIVAVEAAPGTRLPGTASFGDGDYVTPFIAEGFRCGLFDCRVAIHEADAFRHTLELRSRGFYCGPQTGGLVQAALTTVPQLGVSGDVVLLSGDAGWKNMDRLLQASCVAH